MRNCLLLMNTKPKILIIADKPNWAYHIIANCIIDNLSHKYEFYLDFTLNYTPIKIKILSLSFIKSLFHRFLALYVYRKLSRSKENYDIILYLGWYMDKVMPHLNNTSRIIKGIYTEQFPPQGYPLTPEITIKEFFANYLSNTKALVCGSKEISEFYKGYGLNTYYANGAPSKSFLRPIKKSRKSKKFVVGWTGNPKREFKGFYDFVIPAVELAQQKRKGIVFKTRFSGPLRTLHKFYDNVDVVIIASVADAGPSMFIEAALRGVPSIANFSGMPREIIKHRVNGIIVNRDIVEYANALIELYDNRELLDSLSDNIVKDAIDFYNELDMIDRWDKLFEAVLKT